MVSHDFLSVNGGQTIKLFAHPTRLRMEGKEKISMTSYLGVVAKIPCTQQADIPLAK
jgi:hypothetical protein